MNVIPYVIVAAVALQRLAEVAWSQRNTAKLKARGATEIAGGHYPLIVALHVAWLVAMVVFLPVPHVIYAIPLAIYCVLQLGRVWTLATLGPYFTTRIISLADSPLMRHGPYRFVRHPNYLIVFGEVLVLPLVFGEIGVALTFTVLNAGLLAWRIRMEDAALAPRRAVR